MKQLIGEIGPQGVTGPKGDKGSIGLTGDQVRIKPNIEILKFDYLFLQGIQGPKGVKGDKGEQGEKVCEFKGYMCNQFLSILS